MATDSPAPEAWDQPTRLLLLLHFCNNLWKTGVDEEAGRLLEAKGGRTRSCAVPRFAQVFHRIDSILGLLNAIS
jgi:hypothetical protein